MPHRQGYFRYLMFVYTTIKYIFHSLRPKPEIPDFGPAHVLIGPLKTSFVLISNFTNFKANEK